ncbi:sodium-dependent lysophosphatidylcholine symporter 1-B-like [Chanos chanos]|uniref:Sodium-dependent lysophosphatidylcholine symporter 1-B-like n=1 Tax=Chanos chanos TaxID=29144 RepID=A0A6J2W6I6_CHACN|nr:sodium-dependent lysophosphatidylcholine symporter 1-like [Chanos chanos]
MRAAATVKQDGLPLSRKLCYALGGVPFQMTNVVIGFSFQIFLLDVVQMEAFFVSLILFVSRAWDAVTDPLVGYLVSRSVRTPVGKLLPWVILSMPFAVLFYICLWFTPQHSVTSAFSVPWYLIMSCLFETLMTCYDVPYTSLNMFLGGHQRDRDSATAYRMSVEALAMLVGSVIQGQVLKVYNSERDQACQELVQNYLPTQITPSPQTATLHNTRKAFMTSALVVGAVFFLCSLVLFLGVREQSDPGQTHTPYLTGLRMLVGHRPYQRLVLGFLFSSVAFQMSMGNFAIFCTHVAGIGTQFQYLILTLLTTAAVAVPVWQLALLRVGKKTTVFMGLPLFIPALITFASVSDNFPVYVAMCVLAGASLATLFLLPWSMLPDVVDDFAVKNPTCRDLEPLFFSCYVFCNKLGGGLSVGISTMVLYFTGYKAGACSHGDGVATALRVLLAPVPIFLLLVGLCFFYLYPINEAHRQQLRKDLEQASAKKIPNMTK